MIRPARPDDVDAIVRLIQELADYESLSDQVDATPARLRADLFAEPPACAALVAERDPAGASGDDGGELLGYALFFPSYSTFKNRSCLFLEDLYVTPAARGEGLGKALLSRVAAEASARGCPRLDWNVLDWNRDAIDFYERLGAELLPDWRVCRLQGDSLSRLAAVGSAGGDGRGPN